MVTEYVTVWQMHYGGVHREVHYEDDSPELNALIRGCETTVRNHGGVVHLYEIRNDGTMHHLNTFGTYDPRGLVRA